MFALAVCDLHVKYRLTVVSPLLIGGGDEDPYRGERGSERGKQRGPGHSLRLRRREDRGGGENANVTLPIHESAEGEPGGLVAFIPGTSLRGSLRHGLWRRLDHALRAASIAERYRRDVARGDEEVALYGDPNTEQYWSPRFGNVLLRQLFGSEARRGAFEFSRATVRGTSANGVARYSGGPGRKVEGAPANVDLRLLTNNRLDRFTMESTQGLRNVAAVEVGTVFEGSVSIVNFAWWQAGALAVAFDAVNRGDIRLGKRGAAGQGRATVDPIEIVLRYHGAVVPKPTPGDKDARQALPGMGALMAMHRANGHEIGGIAIDRLLGRSERGTSPPLQMFVEDSADFLSLEAPEPERIESKELISWSELRRWQGAERCRSVLTLATQRLAAVAKHISETPSPPAPASAAPSPTPIQGAAHG